MSYSNIEFSIDNGIARINLARPESANTISAAMAEELMQAAIACDGNRPFAWSCWARRADFLAAAAMSPPSPRQALARRSYCAASRRHSTQPFHDSRE